MNEIWVAIIGGISVAIPSVIATIFNNKSNKDLIIYRIDELDKKVHEHNNLVDRTYKLEQKTALLENDMKDLKNAK